MIKRIVLFMVVNFLIMITISVTTSFLGLGNYLTPYGIDYENLMVYCLLWGMAGSFISLGLSRIIAKQVFGVEVIDPNNPGSYYQVVASVKRLSEKAGIPMPQVGIYESPEMNAFATGPSKKRSLVAVSTGLLENMNQNEVDGVIAHEIAHIANGDMVTMTLLQGIVNAFVMFLARVVAFFVARLVREDAAEMVRFIVTIVLDIVFSILGSIVVNYFSRLREYRADSGASVYGGKQNMISALEALKRRFEAIDDRGRSLATFKIANKEGLLSLFSSHPPLEARINALRGKNI